MPIHCRPHRSRIGFVQMPDEQGTKVDCPHPAAEPTDWGMLLLGTAVAAVIAFAVVQWLLRFVRSHTFVGFGWYRIALGGAILLLLIG